MSHNPGRGRDNHSVRTEIRFRRKEKKKNCDISESTQFNSDTLSFFFCSQQEQGWSAQAYRTKMGEDFGMGRFQLPPLSVSLGIRSSDLDTYRHLPSLASSQGRYPVRGLVLLADKSNT